MQRIIFSKKYPHYKYEAERAYLRNQPQTKEIIQQRVDLLYELAMRDVPYFAHFQKSYDANQQRVPAGSTGAGQWVGANIGRGQPHDDNPTTGTIKPAIGKIGRDSNHDGLLHDAHYAPAAIPKLPGPVGAAIAGLAAAIYLYSKLSDAWHGKPNTSDNERPIIEFYARQYSPTETDRAFDLAFTRTLNQEETQQMCPRLAEVQTRVDRIDSQVRNEYPSLSAQQHGTAVHVRLANEINAMRDPDFVAEKSILKGGDEISDPNYGQSGTIRIDILERPKPTTVCVYDLKTGKAGLTLGRSTEIANEVYRNFGSKPTRIILTEVRPKR